MDYFYGASNKKEKAAGTFFKTHPFVFHGIKQVIRVWNDDEENGPHSLSMRTHNLQKNRGTTNKQKVTNMV